MKPIRLTRHARNRMRWHEIDLELIEQTPGTPDWWERSVGGRINCWKRLQGRYIRVTYREEPEEISEGEARRVKIEYDPEADALYIQIREARADDDIDIEEGVTVVPPTSPASPS